jgi:hypothetical protein
MPGQRPARLVGIVLRCYPPRWRSRHGDEAAELAALLMRDGTSACSIAWSYLKGAARERLAPKPGRHLGTAAGALLVAAGSLGVPLALLSSSAPASAANTVRAYITNPGDAASQLASQLESHHLGVTVTREPVSPSLVGTIVNAGIKGSFTGGHNILTGITGPCPAGAHGCTDGIVLPAHFAGNAQLVVGRPARAGETYAVTADIFRPGETLHCSGLLGETLKEALPVLENLHVKIAWDIEGGSIAGAPVPSGAYYVAGGNALSPAAISIRLVAKAPANQNSVGRHGERC